MVSEDPQGVERTPKPSSTVEWVGQRTVYALGIVVKGLQFFRRSPPGVRQMKKLRAKFYVDVWTDAAQSCGTPATIVEGSLLSIPLEEGRLLVRRNLTSLDDHLTVELSENKTAVIRILSRRGIPVPRHLEVDFREVTRAWRFVSDLGSHAVVKPALGGIGGLAVTTNVRTRSELAVAMGFGASWGTRLLVEEMLSGSVYRLLYLDGELLDAVQRKPAHVTGDGSSSISQLIKHENERRRRLGIEAAQELLRVDRDMRQSLRSRGYRLRSVPREGEAVRLKSVINDNSREDNRPVLASIGPELVRAGAEAAGAVGLRLAGVDVITPDPTVSLEEAGGAVVEVNHGPGFYYHYMNSGPGVPVAKMVLERLRARASRPTNSMDRGRTGEPR